MRRILRRLGWTGADQAQQAFPAQQAFSPQQPFPPRINVGCGYDKRSGYLNIDVDPACAPDLLIRDDDYSVIPRNHFQEVCAKDVLEHIPRSATLSALLQWASWLKVGGTLWLQTSSILGVADRLRESPKYADHHGWTICMFGNQVHHGDFHHTGFTEVTLRVQLLAAGLEAADFEIIDGWLFRVTAKKIHGWDDFLIESEKLDVDAFIEKAYIQAFDRTPDAQGRSYLHDQLESRRMTRRQAAMHLFSAPERLFCVAARAGL